MNIIVCIKPIRTHLVFEDSSGTDELMINPYDMFALTEVIKLKQELECKITCLSMGSLETKKVLIKSLALGADEAVLLNDSLAFAGSDTVATAKVLSKAIEKIGCDLVICGKKSVDGETGQVKYGLGERLSLPCISEVETITVGTQGELIVQAQRGEYLKTLGVMLPAMISFHKFTLQYGSVSLMKLKKAQKKNITIWNSTDLEMNREECGLAGSKTKVLETSTIIRQNTGKVVEGTEQEKVSYLLDIISKNL